MEEDLYSNEKDSAVDVFFFFWWEEFKVLTAADIFRKKKASSKIQQTFRRTELMVSFHTKTSSQKILKKSDNQTVGQMDAMPTDRLITNKNQLQTQQTR